jgi:hypothetical protein
MGQGGGDIMGGKENPRKDQAVSKSVARHRADRIGPILKFSKLKIEMCNMFRLDDGVTN